MGASEKVAATWHPGEAPKPTAEQIVTRAVYESLVGIPGRDDQTIAADARIAAARVLPALAAAGLLATAEHDAQVAADLRLQLDAAHAQIEARDRAIEQERDDAVDLALRHQVQALRDAADAWPYPDSIPAWLRARADGIAAGVKP